jgi:hypothetical protein
MRDSIWQSTVPLRVGEKEVGVFTGSGGARCLCAGCRPRSALPKVCRGAGIHVSKSACYLRSQQVMLLYTVTVINMQLNDISVLWKTILSQSKQQQTLGAC